MLRRPALVLAGLIIPALLGGVAARGDVVATGDTAGNPAPPTPGATLDGLSVGNTGTGTLRIDNGSTLTVNTNATGVGLQQGSNGLLVVTGTGSLLTVTGGIILGSGSNFTLPPGMPAGAAVGAIHVLAGATISADSMHIGDSWDDVNPDGTINGRGTGIVVVDGVGSQLELQGDLSCFMGSADIDVRGGGLFRAGSLGSSPVPSAGASFSVSGAGSTFAVDGFAGFGNEPGGLTRIVVDGAGAVASFGGVNGNQCQLGQSSGGIAEAQVTRGGLLEVRDRLTGGGFQSAQLIVGSGGPGTLDVLSGSRLFVHDQGIAPKSASLLVGGNAPFSVSTGALVIDGAGTTAELRGTGAFFSVGMGSIGHAAITNGASMLVDGVTATATTNATVAVGDGRNGFPGFGSLDIAGPLTLTMSASGAGQNNNFHVGVNGGVGVVDITAGGVLSTRFLGLGTVFTGLSGRGDGDVQVGPGGEIRLSGIGSAPTFFTAGCTIGDIGTGRMTLTGDGVDGGVITLDGGSATFPGISIGNTATGVGSFRATGKGARVRSLGATESTSFRVGISGTGTAQILDGATLENFHSVQIGVTLNARGTLTVAGSETRVTITGVQTNTTGPNAVPGQGPVLLVGRGGRGTMLLTDGAQVLIHPDRPTNATTPAAFAIGGSRVPPTGGNGDMTMSNGARLEVGGDVGRAVVGRDGTGALLMTSGSVLRVLNPDGLGVGAVASIPGGTGALTVSGSATLFDGGGLVAIALQVDGVAGGGSGSVTLADGGTIAGTNVRVGPLGTLDGSGSVRGNLVLTGGIVSPGTGTGGIGALSVTGGFTLVSGTARFEVGGTGAGQFDALVASGAVALQGGTIDVRTTGSYTPAIGDRVPFLRGASTSLAAGVSLTGNLAPAGGSARLEADASGIFIAMVAPLPAAPTALVAAAPAPTLVTLVWVDGSTNETGFKIERSLAGANAFTQVGTAAANALTFSDTSAAAGTAYDYRVRATNTGGDSAPSPVASATTPQLGAVGGAVEVIRFHGGCTAGAAGGPAAGALLPLAALLLGLLGARAGRGKRIGA